jgi:hypothetical protein
MGVTVGVVVGIKVAVGGRAVLVGTVVGRGVLVLQPAKPTRSERITRPEIR